MSESTIAIIIIISWPTMCLTRAIQSHLLVNSKEKHITKTKEKIYTNTHAEAWWFVVATDCYCDYDFALTPNSD